MSATKKAENSIASNKKAFFDYHILDSIEAGIVLTGYEIKSIRQGHISLKESFAYVDNGEMWLEGCHITPFSSAGSHEKINPVRRRKLLLHKKEILKLMGKVQEKGMTLIPLGMHFKNSRVKVVIGLAKAKKLFDKRATLKEKTIQRDIDQKWK